MNECTDAKNVVEIGIRTQDIVNHAVDVVMYWKCYEAIENFLDINGKL